MHIIDQLKRIISFLIRIDRYHRLKFEPFILAIGNALRSIGSPYSKSMESVYYTPELFRSGLKLAGPAGTIYQSNPIMMELVHHTMASKHFDGIDDRHLQAEMYGAQQHITYDYQLEFFLEDSGTSFQTRNVESRNNFPRDFYAKEVQLTRHTDIQFPEVCVLNKSESLTIQLTIEPKVFSKVLSEFRIRCGIREEQIHLLVFVSSAGFSVDSAMKPMEVPVSRNSEKLDFVMTPIELGKQVIHMEFYKGADRVGYITLETRVLKSRNPYYWQQ